MPGRAPKGWWDKMEKEVREGNPDYSEDQVRKTIGSIWNNKLSDSKRREIVDRYEKKGVRAVAFMTATDPVAQFEVRTKTAAGTRTFSGTKMKILLDANSAGIPEEAILAALENVAEVADVSPAVRQAKRVTVAEEELKPVMRIAATFPNLLSNDAKKWIQIEVQRIASNYGQPATPEQAQAYIDKAAQEVTKTLADSVNSGVQQVILENRDEIMETLTAGMEPVEDQVPPMPTPQDQIPPQVEQQAVPMGASVRRGLRVPAQLFRDDDAAAEGKILVKLENLDDDMDDMQWVLVTAPWDQVEDEGSINGTMWEHDGDLAYAVLMDQPNLVEEMESEGYYVDDSEYYPFEG